MSTELSPMLEYRTWYDREGLLAGKYDPSGIVGDPTHDRPVTLYDVHEVSARVVGKRDRYPRLRIYVRGRMRTRAGQPGPSRGILLDLSVTQPSWLEAIISDALARLPEATR